MRLLVGCLLFILSVPGFSQEKPFKIKFGDVKAEDFAPTAYEIDSAAPAIVLADIGDSRFDGNNEGFFSIVFQQHKRIRIMNKNGFNAASVSITIYTSNSVEERLDDLEAVTYNLENGKVVATKLDKNSVFKDKPQKNFVTKKFTFPNLKEGSIIEYRYKITTPFFRYLRSWDFQGSMPRLWSQYSVEVPSMFDYVLTRQGYQPYEIDESKTDFAIYNILIPGETASDRSEVTQWKGPTYRNMWAVKNMPALKDEPFTTSTANHIQKIDFQLRAIRWPNGKIDNFMGTWPKMAKDLTEDEDFGATLNKNNGFFDDELNKVLAGASGDYEKAARIYKYVRDHFTCTDHDAIWLSNPLKKVFQSKNGNVADINLMLVAMFRSKKFEAMPVLLSTTEHGKASELYPLINKFNYVVCRVKVGDQYYLLDASRERLGFGKLPLNAYNGYARMITDVPEVIDLSPENLKESKMTTIFIANDEKGGMTATFSSTLGNYESYNTRNRLSKMSQDDFFKDIKKKYSFDIKMSNSAADSLLNYEEPLTVRYDFSFKPDEDIIYLNPLFTEATKENPFKSLHREYPVEMPFVVDEIYVLDMEIPKGYKVEEMPKSARVKLNETEGMFEYIIAHTGDKIQFRSRIVLNKAVFSKDDYDTLRDFFSMIVKKQSEQVVLKKIQ